MFEPGMSRGIALPVEGHGRERPGVVLDPEALTEPAGRAAAKSRSCLAAGLAIGVE